MSHLFPSSSLRGGFFVRMLSGFGFLLGIDDLLCMDVWEDERLGPGGTGAEARREGFLCVISDLSTLRSPDVTAAPREI